MVLFYPSCAWMWLGCITLRVRSLQNSLHRSSGKLSKKPEEQKCAASEVYHALTECRAVRRYACTAPTSRRRATDVARSSDQSAGRRTALTWGSFACEYAGNGSVGEAEANLREAMQQLFVRRYKARFYKLEFGKTVIRTYTPANPSGRFLSASASLVTLCRY